MIKAAFFSILVVSLSIFSVANAATYETGKAGLVVKEARCSLDQWVDGTIVNRTADPVGGELEVAILDPDGDFLWRGVVKIAIGPQNGIALSARIGASKCSPPNRMAFRYIG